MVAPQALVDPIADSIHRSALLVRHTTLRMSAAQSSVSSVALVGAADDEDEDSPAGQAQG